MPDKAATSEFVVRRLAQRYADDTDFQKRIDQALGVYHVPFHPIGECIGCDKERIRREVETDA